MKIALLILAAACAFGQANPVRRIKQYAGVPTAGDCTATTRGLLVGVNNTPDPDTIYDCIGETPIWVLRVTVAAGGVIAYSAPALTLTVGTRYAPPGGGGIPSTTAADSSTKAPSAATITNFQVNASVAPGSGNSWTFTWRKAGADQSVTCAIANTATSCTDTTNSFTAVQGDLIDVKIVSAGTPVSTPMVSWLAQWGTTGSNGTVNDGTASRLAYYPSTGTAVDDSTLTASLVKLATGVPSAATATDVSNVNYVAGGGTAQAQTATLVPAITAQADGLRVCWLPIAANTAAAPTLAVNGLTATTMTKLGTTALVANDLTTTAVACAILVGTNYQLQNPQTVTAGSGDVVGPASSIDTNLASFNGTTGKLIADSGIAAATVVKGAASLTTVGAIPYISAAGTLNQDAADLFWDATNNRLGVGTASPVTGIRQTIVDEANNPYSALRLRSNNLTESLSLGWGGLDSTATLNLNAVTAANLQLNGVAKISIATTTGNVLINTTTDGNFKLDVANSGSSGTFRAYDQTAVTGTSKSVFRDGAGQTGNLIEAQNNAGTALWAIGGGVPRWGDVAEPTCNSTNRGALVMDHGGAAVLDTFRVCRKDAADAYAYVPLMNEGLTVAQGGTGLTAGTSGGILGFTGTGTIASSALLATGAVVVGGGAGATPTTSALTATVTKMAAGVPSAATVGTDYGTPDATTKTLTNTTYDAAATGNVLTITDRVYFTAAGCNNATATGAFDLPTSGAATAVCIGTTTTSGLLDFADAATQSGTVHWVLPPDWTSTIDVILRYTGSTSSTNAIRWQVSTACVADTEDLIAPSYNAASASNSAGPTTAGQRKSVTFSSVAVTNCAVSEQIYLKVERVGADAGDTYTGTGRLLSASIIYSRAM